MPRTKAEKQAQHRYYQRHKAEWKRTSYKSRAKHFITDYATKDELVGLLKLIQKKLKNL